MTKLQDIGCVILGAGFSRRFGRDKRIAKLQHSTVAATTLGTYCAAFAKVRLVLREEDDPAQFTADLGKFPHLEIIRAPLAYKGMGHSLSAGFAAIDWSWAFVALLDMPFVSHTTLVGLITHARNSSAPLIQPRLVSALATAVKPLERQHGHPIGIHNRLFSEVRASVGDNGARRLIQQRAEQIDYFDCDDVGVIQDIDHPSDLPAENQ